MKNIRIIITMLIIGITSFSCEDPLERTAIGIFTDENVWNSESLADLAIANVFARTHFLPGGDTDDVNGLVVDACAGGYSRTFGGWPTGYRFTQGAFSSQGGTGNNSNEYWRWQLVRDINEAIFQLNSPNNGLPTEYKNTRLGELYFLRAWVYLQKVKRYGGVPILKEPQSTDLSIEELRVPRNSEEEVYDFIAEDCDKAEALLEGKTQEYGRPTKWAALALKSRAMLYAGSIGEFGTMQLNGLLGISNADKYWQLSYEASNKIINEGGFALFGTGASSFAQAEQNYYNLFTREEGNSETIFAEIFEGEGSKSESWERWCAPAVVGGTTFMNTYLETFEMYEYTDGRSGQLDRSTLVSGVFHDMADFIGNKDPRCRANIFLPEVEYAGETVWMHEGLYVNGVLETSNVDGVDVPAKGPGRDIQRTGFFNKKRSNEDFNVGNLRNAGGTDFMVFRLGEIYLNLAEAAFALERNPEALEALNTIRRRVLMPDKTLIDWQTIQNERAVELAFEQHRYWDLRRWRIAEQELDRRGKKYSGVRWRKDYDNPGMYEIIHTTTGTATDGWDRIFEEHHYYFPIGLERIQRSPVLVENPGYE